MICNRNYYNWIRGRFGVFRGYRMFWWGIYHTSVSRETFSVNPLFIGSYSVFMFPLLCEISTKSITSPPNFPKFLPHLLTPDYNVF